MVNFKLGDKVVKMKWSTWHERGTKKKTEPRGLCPTRISLSFTTTISALLFLAVRWTRVIHELSLMASLSLSSRGSVDRALVWCTEGHGFDYCRKLGFFLCPTLVSCWLFHFYQFFLSFSKISVCSILCFLMQVCIS